jgi:hypothetical protein
MTTVKDVMSVLHALLDNKDSLLKCNDHLWHQLNALLRQLKPHRLSAKYIKGMESNGDKAVRLLRWNMEDMDYLLRHAVSAAVYVP